MSAKRDGETTRDLATSWNTRETRENTEEPKYVCCQMKENTANSKENMELKYVSANTGGRKDEVGQLVG